MSEPALPRRQHWWLLCVVSMSLLATRATYAVVDDVDDENGNSTTGVTIVGPPAPVAPAVVSRDENNRVTLRATRLDEPLVLDGKLDEAVYARVPAVSDFIQQDPAEGQPATEKTEAWVFFDAKNVYVTARCWDSHPERMVFNEMRRDNFGIFQNENVTIVFDTFYDHRNGFFFQTNPLGALRDQSVADEGQSNNQDWNTVWNVKASVFDQGWIVEIAIPFKSLRYQAGRDQIWGFNLRRSIRWKNEETYLSPVARSHRFRGIYRFSEAATLVGIQAPAASRNFELKPYGISTVVTNTTADPPVLNDAGADFGFDAKYGLTKGLVADFTYNTDFAQVEEDAQQVNLSRFSLFFPEKRDFFLEGQGIFAFAGVQLRGGGSNRPGRRQTELTPIMFFSRRIGLTENGIDPILAGGRVTGRAGAFRIGALNIQTEGLNESNLGATNFSVVRVRRDVFSRSDVGFIGTYRNTSVTEGGLNNGLIGLDGNFNFFTNLRVNSFYARSHTSADSGASLGGDESSYMGRVNYNGDRYGATAEHLKVGEQFRPEIGFLRRLNFRRNFVTGRFSPRPRSIESVRRFVLEGDFDNIADNDGRLETRIFAAAFRTEFNAGDEAAIEYTNNYEFLPEDFEISDGIILPVAEYEFQDVRFVYRLAPQRKVPGFVTFRVGQFFSGSRRELTGNARIEFSSKFSMEPRVSLNFVKLPEGDFTAKLFATRITYTHSPRMVLGSLIQYNSSSSTLSTSVRFRWEYEPGSDLFIVYSDGRDTELGWRRFPLLQNRTFAVKFTKLIRF